MERHLKECGGDCSCSCADKGEEDVLAVEIVPAEQELPPPLEFDYKSLEGTPYTSIFER